VTEKRLQKIIQGAGGKQSEQKEISYPAKVPASCPRGDCWNQQKQWRTSPKSGSITYLEIANGRQKKPYGSVVAHRNLSRKTNEWFERKEKKTSIGESGQQ